MTVAGSSLERIGRLTLKVLDPAMGSGAFLVAACRYLAAAAEERLIAEGRVSVNGLPVRAQGLKIDPSSDTIEVNGQRLHAGPQAKRYFLFHKF